MNLTQAQSKHSQIVQNFFSKAAQVIAEARLSAEDLRQDDSPPQESSLNKWFNLELRELEFLHESLAPWLDINLEEPPPPLIVECYLNPSKLRPGQTVVLGDARCSSDKEIVLERWVIEFKPTKSSEPISFEDLPLVYKRAIVSIRSLYTALRLLPTFRLHQRLCRQKLISVPLKLGIKIHNGAFPISSRGRIGLTKAIADKRSQLQQFHIQPVPMPIGSLSCSVTYRTDVQFSVEDIEKLMAQKFLELDSPQGGPSFSTGTPGSVGSTGTAASFQPGSHSSLGPRPVLNFTRPFRSPDIGSSNNASLPRSIPSSVNSGGPAAPQYISGSASSVISTSSRFSSSFASQRGQPAIAKPQSHDSHQHQTTNASSQGSHDRHQGPMSLEPGNGLYIMQSDVGDFVKFVDDARKKGSERIRQSSADVETSLAHYQSMRSSFMQLSDSIMQGSVSQGGSNSNLERRRGSGPRSRLGFYVDHDEEDERDPDLLFALSDMHI